MTSTDTDALDDEATATDARETERLRRTVESVSGDPLPIIHPQTTLAAAMMLDIDDVERLAGAGCSASPDVVLALTSRVRLAESQRDLHCRQADRLERENARITEENARLTRACVEGLPREVIACPECNEKHIEGARHDDPSIDGRVRPHHTHRCYSCGHVWDAGRWSYGDVVPCVAVPMTAHEAALATATQTEREQCIRRCRAVSDARAVNSFRCHEAHCIHPTIGRGACSDCDDSLACVDAINGVGPSCGCGDVMHPGHPACVGCNRCPNCCDCSGDAR